MARKVKSWAELSGPKAAPGDIQPSEGDVKWHQQEKIPHEKRVTFQKRKEDSSVPWKNG